MVLSSWLAALCKQLLCLKVIARYLGFGYGLILGRQAAWRPGTNGMVSSSLLAALCRVRVAGCRQTARCKPRHCLNVQTVCFAQEGALNKFLVDGRVCCSCWSSGFHRWSVQMFTRAVLASVDIFAVLRKTRTTGRSYCGISGSPKGWSTRSLLTWCTFPHG